MNHRHILNVHCYHTAIFNVFKKLLVPVFTLQEEFCFKTDVHFLIVTYVRSQA